jgi:hypothetical protein
VDLWQNQANPFKFQQVNTPVSSMNIFTAQQAQKQLHGPICTDK